MERLTRWLAAALLFATLLLPTQAVGQQFVFSLTANASDPLIVGLSKTIGISVSYVNGSGGTNFLQSEGLRLARVLLRRDNTSVGNISIVNPTLDNDITVNNLFTSRTVTAAGTAMTGYTTINGFSGTFLPTASGITTTGSTPIFMGSFNVTGTTPGSLTLRFALPFFTTAGNFGSPQPGFITSNFGLTGRDLTPFLSSTFVDATFNVVSVPEPATWAMIILSIAAGIGGIVWYRRQRLAQANHQMMILEEAIAE